MTGKKFTASVLSYPRFSLYAANEKKKGGAGSRNSKELEETHRRPRQEQAMVSKKQRKGETIGVPDRIKGNWLNEG